MSPPQNVRVPLHTRRTLSTHLKPAKPAPLSSKKGSTYTPSKKSPAAKASLGWSKSTGKRDMGMEQEEDDMTGLPQFWCVLDNLSICVLARHTNTDIVLLVRSRSSPQEIRYCIAQRGMRYVRTRGERLYLTSVIAAVKRITTSRLRNQYYRRRCLLSGPAGRRRYLVMTQHRKAHLTPQPRDVLHR